DGSATGWRAGVLVARAVVAGEFGGAALRPAACGAVALTAGAMGVTELLSTSSAPSSPPMVEIGWKSVPPREPPFRYTAASTIAAIPAAAASHPLRDLRPGCDAAGVFFTGFAATLTAERFAAVSAASSSETIAANSSIEAKRSRGSLAIARVIADASPAGALGSLSISGGGSETSCL